MTEDEAKKCWCPFARPTVIQAYDDVGPAIIAPDGRTVHLRDERPVEVTQHCIGSACMAWRSYSVIDEAALDAAAKLHNENSGAKMGVPAAREIVLRNKGKPFTPEAAFLISHGFCGLAGAPA